MLVHFDWYGGWFGAVEIVAVDQMSHLWQKHVESVPSNT